jgi:hypothetical protein
VSFLRATRLAALFISLALVGPRANARDEAAQGTYDSCCICIRDVVDEKLFLRACARWLDEKSKAVSCQYRKTISMADAAQFENVSRGEKCRSLHLYGAFHGLSDMTAVPFQYSAKAAEAYQSKSVCYDGASCLVFDNIDDVKACAKDLSKTKGCRFEISGNQNVSLLKSNPWLCIRPTEPFSATSKLTMSIDAMTVKLQYAPCTKEGDQCGYLANTGPDFIGYRKSKNDPNAKWCEHERNLVQQRCCHTKGYFGKWSGPGEECPKT